jgi:cardiolipin-specific phospholipase
MPYYHSSDKPSSSPNEYPVIAHSSQVELSHPKQHLNTLTIASTEPSTSAPPPAVVLHGYGAGLGFFFQNFPALGEWAGSRKSTVYAVDWLGMGRSARVPFTVKAKRDDIDGRVHEAESFFVESLEDWRRKMGMEKMTLVGHSLGGYLSIAYALRYPTRVSKLILLSPAGIPRDPNNTSLPSREVTDSPVTANADQAEPATKKKVESLRSEQREERQKESRTRKLFMYLWEEGWSPFQVVRTAGLWAPLLVGKYSSRRFIGLGMEDTKAMHEYILNITLAKGSGEYCIC